MTHVAYAGLVLVLVSLLLLGAGAVADEGLAHTGERTDIVDETFDPAVGIVVLDNSNQAELTYSDDVQVVDKSGNHSIEGADYIWHSDNGTIEVLAGGNLDGDNTATIDYIIWNPTTQDESIGDTMATLVGAGNWIPIILLVALMLGAVVVLGGLG